MDTRRSWLASQFERTEQIVRVRSAMVILFASAVFLSFFYSTGRYAFLFPILGAAVGSAMAMVVPAQTRNFHHFDQSDNSYLAYLTKPKFASSLVLLFVTFLVSIHQFALYNRPAVAFLVYGIAFAYLTLCIQMNRSKLQNLAHIFLVAITIYWSGHLIFPSGTRYNNAAPRTAEQIFQRGEVAAEFLYSIHPGFLIQTGAYAEIAGIPSVDSYSILALIIVAGTVFVIGNIDQVIPSLSPRAAQYSALILATASYTLNRGANPHFTSFFYIHTAVILIVLFSLLTRRLPRRFSIVGGLMVLAATFGHEYSAGAPIAIIGFVLPIFLVYYFLVLGKDRRGRYLPVGIFVSMYSLVFFGHQIYYRTSGGMFRRLGATIVSLNGLIFDVGTTSGDTGTSGGIYSQLPLETLFQATLGDVLLFTFMFAGISILLRQDRYDLDLIVLIVTGGFFVIAAGLFINQSDIPSHRLYHTLMIFGACIAAGVGFYSIGDIPSPRYRTAILCTIMFFFAVFSVYSPIAGMALSPLDFPHGDREYTTAYSEAGDQWTNEFADGQIFGQTEFRSLNETTVEVNRSGMGPGRLYVYDQLYAETGVEIRGTSDFGQAEYAYVSPDPRTGLDERVYSNGESSAYLRSSITT